MSKRKEQKGRDRKTSTHRHRFVVEPGRRKTTNYVCICGCNLDCTEATLPPKAIICG